MTKRLMVLCSAIVALGMGFSPAVFAQSGNTAKSTAAHPKVVGSATQIIVHGKIVAVNRAEKLVTVEGPRGRKLTLKVENPYNLKAAKVGEPVVAHFYEVVTIRKKKPGEKIPGVSIKQGIATAQPGQVPGAAVARQLQLVVTVLKIDKKHGTVTIKGPEGAVETVKAHHPKNLNLIKVGDELVVTLSRAVAISLEKAAAH